ncbi:3'(2'),5'-bisphosphate nucleotidase [hydrothermal vent metagenome]|uniref:3'(2'),5'-bisphosphate nucleotidase n=1 Tax=hydrothermal vent metagenome TaxID=652676 RepID=A0A3B0WLF9_9ZZZZ
MSNTLDLNTSNLQRLCLECVDIARDAGDAILTIYDEGFSVEEKEDKSPLTDADLASHNLILQRLTELTPDIPILSEESAKLPFEERSSWETYWLVDPLDGTREFVKRNGEFTVNIALIHQHKSIIGVINVPVLDIDYYAWQNGGCYKIEKKGDAAKISVKKLDGKQLTAAGSRSHGSEMMQQYMANLAADNGGEVETLSMGSSLKFCLVAEGRADLYPRLGLTSEWDTGAAHCIVIEAGGYITQTDMSPLEYNTKDSLLNPFFFVFGDDSCDWSQYLNEQS